MNCYICLDPTTDDAQYHAQCLKRLFDTGKPPTLDIDTVKLHTAAQAMVGHTSLSGIQKKISLGLTADKGALRVVANGGNYILKPQTGTYPSIPENEHVTTRIAELVAIDTASAGLVELTDGTRAFIVRRFDRLADGRKVHQEDFCQLSEQSPKDKYNGSAEQCIKIVRAFASEPMIELLKFFRMCIFGWWTGNGDMHLKNFSMLTDEQRIVRLTPAYDLVSTHLVIHDDPLALAVGGKKTKLTRADWLRLAEYAKLPRNAAERVLREQRAATNRAIDLVESSLLPDEQKAVYKELIAQRSEQLDG